MTYRSFDAAAVAAASPWPVLLESLAKAFAAPYVAPDRHIHKIAVPGADEATALLMPAWIEGEHYGVKLANIFPSNGRIGLPAVTSLYALFSARTGQLEALMDGGAITVRRTAAASVLAATRLARPDSNTLLVLGAGRMAPLLVEAYRAALPIRRVLIWARRPEQASLLAATLGATAVDDLDAAVAETDIVSSATLSRSPLIRGAALRPGTHIDLIGAYAPEMRETDGMAVNRSEVFIDTLGGAKTEAGDLIQAIAEGLFSWDRVAGDLEGLVSGAHPGRTSPDAITMFKSVGAAIEDLAIARLVFGDSGL